MSTIRILVLAYYYSPDLSACSFRVTPLVEAMAARGGDDVEIEVVTTQPNRYGAYEVQTPAVERSGKVTVVRVGLPKIGNGMAGQALGFVWYALGVLRHVRGRRYDLVFATSSRLMTAALGAFIARFKAVPLYLDIRDLFVDTMKHILPRWAGSVLLPIFTMLERWSFARAVRINLVSRGFEPYMRATYPGKELSWFTNGIDPGFEPAPLKRTHAPTDQIEVLYAGNIGDGQGLHNIIPGMAKLAAGAVRFKLIGDGGRRAALESAIAAEGVGRWVELTGPCSRRQVAAAYATADVLFLHLNDFDAFAKVLPSKVFEYAATGKPICAGVGGYAAKFIREEIENAEVFPPCDAQAGSAALKRLMLSQTDRSAFVRNYSRDQISRQLADEILRSIGVSASR